MSIPLHSAERPYNCTRVADGVTRSRPPFRGTLVVWRVLGFGGVPNPLVYSRAASFASRIDQAPLLAEAHFQL